MSKPLELVVYPHVTVSLGPYDNPTYGPHPELFLGQDGTEIDAREFAHKRLTDAELAAEYQFSRLDSRVRMARVENYSGDKVLFDHYERGLDQEATFERFATHPHYDEDAA